MRLIGLTGPAGSGKDTVARLLCEQHGFVQIAFADPLRAMLKAGLGLTDEHFTHRDLKEAPLEWLGKSPRQLLQTLGTEWGRHQVHSNLWQILAARRIAQIKTRPPCLHIAGIVASDVRFDNEADFIRDQGGQVWHLYREVSPVAEHASERGIRTWWDDIHIENTGSLEDLESVVAGAMGVES